MSHEQSQSIQISANSYQLPEDQLSFQMSLQDNFAQQFPESQAILDVAIGDIQRAAGYNIPKYKFDADSANGGNKDSITDELGYVSLPSTTIQFSALVLRRPVKHTREQFKAMPLIEADIAAVTQGGTTIIGDVPAQAAAMIEGIYALTGATVVRDDRADGETSGTVIRGGIYQGENVFFSEDFDDDCKKYEGRKVLQLWILGEDSARMFINDLSISEQAEFIRLSGIRESDYVEAICSNSINRHNFRVIADVLGQTKDVMDKAISLKSRHTRVLGKIGLYPRKTWH